VKVKKGKNKIWKKWTKWYSYQFFLLKQFLLLQNINKCWS